MEASPPPLIGVVVVSGDACLHGHRCADCRCADRSPHCCGLSPTTRFQAAQGWHFAAHTWSRKTEPAAIPVLPIGRPPHHPNPDRGVAYVTTYSRVPAHLYTRLRGGGGRLEQLGRRRLVEILLAAVVADARGHPTDDDSGLTALECHGHLPRSGLALSADDTRHGF